MKHFILPESGAMVVPANAAARMLGKRNWVKWFDLFVDANKMVCGKDYFLDFMNTIKSGDSKKELMAFFNPSSLIQHIDIESQLYSELSLLIGTKDSTLTVYDLARSIGVDLAYVNQRVKYTKGLKPRVLFMKKNGECAWNDQRVHAFTEDEFRELFAAARTVQSGNFHNINAACNERADAFWLNDASNKGSSASKIMALESVFTRLGFDGKPRDSVGAILPRTTSWKALNARVKKNAYMRKKKSAVARNRFEYKPMHKASEKRPKQDKIFHFGTPDGVIRQKADAETVANFGRHGV